MRWSGGKRTLSSYHRFRTWEKFLLDCPIQRASCERLFKYFGRYHIKVRNKLHASTTLKSTQILHDIRRTYPEENKPGSGTFTRNRMVRATEYSCLNKDRDADEEGEEYVNSRQAGELVDDQELFREEDESEIDFRIR